MKIYELLYIIPSKYTEKETDGITKEVETAVTEAKINIIESKPPEKRAMAYPVGRSHFGIYCLLKIAGDGDSINKLDEKLRLMPEIARHQIFIFKETQRPDLEKIKRSRKERKPLQAAPPARKSDASRKEAASAEEKLKESSKIEKGKIKLEELDQKLEELLKE